MLYYLFTKVYTCTVCNVFRYISFRALMAGLTAFFIGIIIGPWFIRKLSKTQTKQVIREDGPKSHFEKEGTPTMGGALIITSILFSTLLWADLSNSYIWILIYTMLSYAFIGWLDDHLKISKHNTKGLRGKFKIILQIVFGIGFYFLMKNFTDNDMSIVIPFIKNIYLNLGVLTIFFVILVLTAGSNAVNLTDGLDGLAIGPIIISVFSFMVFAYLSGHSFMANYLRIPYLFGTGEIIVFGAAIFMAGLSFLWFNSYPAQVFMGDIGALSLGAVISAMSIMVWQELLLLVIGGVFVIEAVSVIMQVFSFKTRGKRIFRMAPIHHHYELKGLAEPKVIVRFWIISIILAIIGIATLKLR